MPRPWLMRLPAIAWPTIPFVIPPSAPLAPIPAPIALVATAPQLNLSCSPVAMPKAWPASEPAAPAARPMC